MISGARLLALIAFTAGCAVNPVTGQQQFVLMSEQQELAAGRQANQQVLQQYRIYPDQQLQRYVNAVGQQLAAKSHRSDLTYTFTVVDSTEVNAFALPGGYVYITRGLLGYLNSEAELAAVLGHEIGHITARHAVRQQTSAQAASVGAGMLSILVPELANAGLGETVNMLGTALLRGYGREHELEADRLGADYLAKSGYDPQAMLAVIRTLKEQEIFDQRLARLEGREARAYHGVFSTHPDNDTRLREIIDYAAAERPAADGVYRDRFLDEIDGMIFGPNPAEGVLVGNTFYHPDLGIAMQFPAGWNN
jgi:predicted Zn-dependent protease